MKTRRFLSAVVLGLVVAVGVSPVVAQDSTSKGEIKKSGSETKEAGKILGKKMKLGRVVRGGKYFGKHMGRAGKHFGRSTKKAFKKVFS